MKTLYKTLVNTLLTLSLTLCLSIISTVLASESPVAFPMNEEVIEDNIVVENWMTDLNNWNVIEATDDFSSEFEADFTVENWMLNADKTNWTLCENVEEESEMKVENWMSDLAKW